MHLLECSKLLLLYFVWLCMYVSVASEDLGSISHCLSGLHSAQLAARVHQICPTIQGTIHF